ncbi:helix-turn-helix domain-containing protein [Chamaesiphon sp. VAR_48_metabat_135_sub]|uniref:helix-turn-helix domain-containing protein n=1 Tax=Chamaesiphon sp. VAR_48_metabat_135_sub TaxID=2964699 RepID=UPI00286AE38A|nr:helix-turn-helix domain-containing protein [Chamaesiphon sp. VAR_48_metabat_135_sub]
MTLLEPLKYITTLKLPNLSDRIGKISTFNRLRTSIQTAKNETVSVDGTLPIAIGDLDTHTAPADFLLEPLQPNTPIPEPEPPTPSQILYQIGTRLRQWREHYQLSIEDISARTQIQPRLIQAIEEGYLEVLPEPVYVKGMVKRYANSLGLDGMAISQQVIAWEPEITKFESVTKIQNTGFHTPVQMKPLHVYLGYTLAIFGIGAGTSHLLNNAFKHPSTNFGETTIRLHQAAGIAVKPAMTQPKPAQFAGVTIGISVKNPTWAQIGIDGTTKFTGNLKAGAKFNWIAKKQVTISTNNAGGLLLSRDRVNAASTDRQAPQPLGKIGQKQSVTIKVGN